MKNQSPRLMVAVLLTSTLCFGKQIFSQETHRLQLKVDEVSSKLGAAHQAVKYRLNPKLANLRRVLSDSKQRESELTTARNKIKTQKSRVDRLKSKLKQIQLKNQNAVLQLQKKFAANDRALENLEKVRIKHDSYSPPPDQLEAYNREAEEGNRRGRLLITQRKRLEEERSRLIKEGGKAIKHVIDYSVAKRKLAELDAEEKRLASSLRQKIDNATSKAANLLSEILKGVRPSRGGHSPIPQERGADGYPLDSKRKTPEKKTGGIFTSQQPVIGAMGAVKGDVYVIDSLGNKHKVNRGADAYHNAKYITGDNGHFQIMLKDETVFTVGPSTEITLDNYVYDPANGNGLITAKITKGIFRFVTGKLARKKPKNFKVKIPVGTIGIRGTDFVVEVSNNGVTKVGVTDGAIVYTPNGSTEETLVEAGRQIQISKEGKVSFCETSDAEVKMAALLPMPNFLNPGSPEGWSGNLTKLLLASLLPLIALVIFFLERKRKHRT